MLAADVFSVKRSDARRQVQTHQQATATKRDSSQNDCKRLTAIIFFLAPVVFFQMTITSLIPMSTEQSKICVLKLYI